MRNDAGIAPVRDGRYGPDYALLGAMAAMALLGLAALWSASSGFALASNKAPHYFAVRQIGFLAAGALVFTIVAMLPQALVRSWIGPVAIVALLSLGLPLVPALGGERNGASRWIDFGFTTFQPSELWKPLMVVYLANNLDRRKEELMDSSVSLFPPAVVVLLGCGLILAQSDFSTAALTAAAGLAVFWICGAKPDFFAFAGMVAVPASVMMVASSEYRLRRIIGFLAPGHDPQGISYQVRSSVTAIVSGGFLGNGLGLGTRKLSSIPEVQSDFVFAAFVEETGFLGVVAVFALWVFIAWRTWRALRHRDDFMGKAGIGLLFLLGMQFLANVAVVSGVIPATGIALPFFSSGGSSLLATAVACGFMFSATRQGVFVSMRSGSALETPAFARPDGKRGRRKFTNRPTAGVIGGEIHG